MRLEVTPSELEGLAHGLSGLLGDLEVAGDIRSISPAAAENVELQSAIERLIVRWTDDIQDIRVKLQELGGRLNAAGAEYERVERRVTEDIALTPAIQPDAEPGR
jgi:acetate kinase